MPRVRPSPLSGSRCLLTGVSGYLGSHLARALGGRGVEVHGLSRPGADRRRLKGLEGVVTVHEADLLDSVALGRALAQVRPDGIFHGAVIRPAPGLSDSEITAANVTGTHHLVEAAVEAGVERLVIAGSATEYGPGKPPLREEDPSPPGSPYGTAKAAATTLGLRAHEQGRLQVTVLRLFYLYGLDEKPERLIPSAIRAVLSGRPLPLTGPGLRRDYVFVEDAVDACVRSLNPGRPSGQVVNVGTGTDTSNEEVVELLGELMGRPVTVAAGRLPPRATDRTHWCADVSRAARVLGWRPTTSLRQGLARCVAWHRERVGGTSS